MARRIIIKNYAKKGEGILQIDIPSGDFDIELYIKEGVVKSNEKTNLANNKITNTIDYTNLFKEYIEGDYDKAYELYDTVIQLANIWGIVETLEDVPSIRTIPTNNQVENRLYLINMAREYISITEDIEIVEFLKNKVLELSKQI